MKSSMARSTVAAPKTAVSAWKVPLLLSSPTALVGAPVVCPGVTGEAVGAGVAPGIVGAGVAPGIGAGVAAGEFVGTSARMHVAAASMPRRRLSHALRRIKRQCSVLVCLCATHACLRARIRA